ncbi:hypothetical protein PoB_000936100 [Plakobranchus ocellatus]|uniref:Uncharacterized protein n=1 Tax=Plakobranchus ocellatus TaxID=259542 RepID=A0AAV3YKE5_9GAST|nr:hypothetical protein PoB_000936100 [Plakobranchus ocellatus]
MVCLTVGRKVATLPCLQFGRDGPVTRYINVETRRCLQDHAENMRLSFLRSSLEPRSISRSALEYGISRVQDFLRRQPTKSYMSD